MAPTGRAVGTDFSPEMLELARRRAPGLEWQQADALALPFAASSFDASTIAFGLRNLADPGGGAREMARLVKPGGRLVVLEFVRPPQGMRGGAYRFYLERVLPRLGGWLSGEPSAYRYLSDTIGAYLEPAALIGLLSGAGWQAPRLQLLNLGTVALVVGAAGGQ